MSNPVLRMAASPTLHSCLSRRKNRQLLLPRLGEGWDGECPVSFYRHSEQRNVIQNPLQVQSDPKKRHTGLDPVSPASREDFKINFAPNNPSNYATLNQVQSGNISTPHSNSLPIGRENKHL